MDSRPNSPFNYIPQPGQMPQDAQIVLPVSQPNQCLPPGAPSVPEPIKTGRGRPKGFDGTRSRMPSALAQAFKQNGLDWKADFASAIKANNRARIKLWLKLLPYMITTTKRAKVGKWNGRPSKAAQIALEAMEQEL